MLGVYGLGLSGGDAGCMGYERCFAIEGIRFSIRRLV